MTRAGILSSGFRMEMVRRRRTHGFFLADVNDGCPTQHASSHPKASGPFQPSGSQEMPLGSRWSKALQSVPCLGQSQMPSEENSELNVRGVERGERPERFRVKTLSLRLVLS